MKIAFVGQDCILRPICNRPPRGVSTRRKADYKSAAAYKAALQAIVLLIPLTGAVAHAQIFDYDKRAPLNLTPKEMDTRDGIRLSTCTFDTKGGKANGFLVEPTASGPHPAIVWMHSSGPLNWVADATLLAQAGAVSLILDPPSGGPDDAYDFRNSIVRSVVAMHREVH